MKEGGRREEEEGRGRMMISSQEEDGGRRSIKHVLYNCMKLQAQSHNTYTSKLIVCSLSFSLQHSLPSHTSLPLISFIHYSHLQRHFTVYIVVYIVYSYLQRQFTGHRLCELRQQ